MKYSLHHLFILWDVHKIVRSQGGGGLSSTDNGVSSDADVRTFWCKNLGFRNLLCVRMDDYSLALVHGSEWRHSHLPGHAGRPGNELADSLAKTGATLPFAKVPASPGHCKDKALVIPAVLLRDEIFLTILSSARFLWFPQLLALSPSSFRPCKLLRLRCHGYSLLLSSYL